MRILVTGATGFVGKHLLVHLKNTNHTIIVLVRDKAKFQSIHSAYESIAIISTKESNWKTLIKQADPEIVIHLAAFLSSGDDELAIESLVNANLLFGTHLLDALQETSIKYFINTGTFAEYLNNDGILKPAYLYAATKSAFRSILSYYQSILNFRTINVIPYTIYGDLSIQKKVIDYIYESAVADNVLLMSPGEQVLDFIHIEDVVTFYQTIIDKIGLFEEDYVEIHLGTGIGTTPKRIATLIEKKTLRKTNIRWGSLSYRKRDTMFSVAKEILPSFLNWKPSINIEEGLNKYISLLENKNNKI